MPLKDVILLDARSVGKDFMQHFAADHMIPQNQLQWDIDSDDDKAVRRFMKDNEVDANVVDAAASGERRARKTTRTPIFWLQKVRLFWRLPFLQSSSR